MSPPTGTGSLLLLVRAGAGCRMLTAYDAETVGRAAPPSLSWLSKLAVLVRVRLFCPVGKAPVVTRVMSVTWNSWSVAVEFSYVGGKVTSPVVGLTVTPGGSAPVVGRTRRRGRS